MAIVKKEGYPLQGGTTSTTTTTMYYYSSHRESERERESKEVQLPALERRLPPRGLGHVNREGDFTVLFLQHLSDKKRGEIFSSPSFLASSSSLFSHILLPFTTSTTTAV